MAGINRDYVESMFELARKEGRLEELYRSGVSYSSGKENDAFELPQELKELAAADREHGHPLLNRFLALAGHELKIVDVEVISAVPLSPEQLSALERRMVQIIKKRLNIKLVVDPSIIGGLRVVVGNHVVDSSIKSHLEELKENLYEGVYFHHEPDAN